MNARPAANEIDSGSSNFEYVCTRVRARKAKLFDEDDYRKLVRMSPNEIARYMEENGYDREINRLGARHSGVDLIEYALYDSMARTFHDIVGWSEGPLRSLVVDYLRKYDAWNVKTVLRGVYTDATEEEIRADLIPAGELSEEDLDGAVAADSVDSAVEALGDTYFSRALDGAMDDYRDQGFLLPLENAVDRAFYTALVAEEAPQGSPRAVYYDFLRSEIDLLNVRNALRVAGSPDVDVEDYYVEGGEMFGREELARLVEDREELVEALRESTHGDDLSDALDMLEESDSLVEFDRALDELLMGFAQQMTYRNPLSIAPVIAYILAKEREVNNIRGIARGKEAGLSVEEIEREVVL
ncbi:MAG: ATP synthase A1 subunit C [Halobacteriota archaeon]